MLVGLLCGSLYESRAELIFTPAAVDGQPAPGTTAGVTFSGNFSDVQINDVGEVMFIANVSGSGVFSTNQTGMWIGLPSELALAAREGSQAPDYEKGVTFSYFGKPVLAGNGVVSFYARLIGPGMSTDAVEPGNDDTLWGSFPPMDGPQLASTRQRPETARNRILRKWTSERGSITPNGVVRVLVLFKTLRLLNMAVPHEYALENDFNLWYWGTIGKYFLSESTSPQGLHAANEPTSHFGIARMLPDGSISAVALTGDGAPGTSEIFQTIDGNAFAASSGGKIAFIATTSSKAGIWSGTATNLQPTALYNTPLPASLQPVFGPAARWGGFGFVPNLDMNARGEVAFGAYVNSASYLFAGPPAAPRMAVRLVKSNSAEAGFSNCDRMVMNAAGDLAFTGEHTLLREVPGIGGIPGAGINGLGLTYQHGPPVLMLAEGKTAPGLKDGEVISTFGYGGGPFMNRHGQVVLLAEIGKVAYGGRTDQGIWLIDPERGAQLVVRGGTQINLGAGRIATIEPRSVRFTSTHDGFRSGGEDGHPKPCNDLGQVVFIASWTVANGASGSGVLVAGEVRMLGGQKVGEDIRVAFATALGRKYRVEFRDVVESGAWATLKESVDGTGGSVIATDVGAAKLPKRFYRVAALP